MSHFEENILSHDDALHATSDSGTFLPLSVVHPTWQINNGSYRLTDARDARYVPEFFSIAITPNNTAPVLLYLENQLLPAITSDSFILKFHARVLCESQITATGKVGPFTEVIPDGIATVGTSGNWFVANSNDLHVPQNANYSGVKVHLSISGHQGNPIYVTMPSLIDDHGFKFNNFVLNGRKYMPTYYWDIDAQQEAPTHPLFKILDIYTSDADKSVRRYVDWFQFEADERLPSVQDSRLTESTLTNPDWVDDENKDWLAQFTGNKIRNNVRTTSSSYTTFDRTSNTGSFTQGELQQVYDLMSGTVDLQTESPSLGFQEIGRQMFSADEGRLYGCRDTEFGNTYLLRFNSDVGGGTSDVQTATGALVHYRDPKTRQYADLSGFVDLNDRIDTNNQNYAVSFEFTADLYALLRLVGEAFVFVSTNRDVMATDGKYGVIHPRKQADNTYTHNNTLNRLAGGYFIRCSRDGTVVFTSRDVGDAFFFERYDPNSYFSYTSSASAQSISDDVGEFIDLSDDGNVFISSGPTVLNSGLGEMAVYEFTNASNTAPQLSSTRLKLTSRNIQGVATNRDGSTIAFVEVNNDTTTPFQMHVMDWDGSNYQTRQLVDLPNTTTQVYTDCDFDYNTGTYGGLQISMSGDGNRIAFVNPVENTYGAVYVFQWEKGSFVPYVVWRGYSGAGDLSPAVAIDSYGTTVAFTAAGKGYVSDWSRPDSAASDRNNSWRLRRDLVTGNNYVSAGSDVSFAFLSTVDLSDGGDVVVWGAQNASSLGAMPVMVRWDVATSSWVSLNSDFTGSVPDVAFPTIPARGCGVAIPDWASMPQRSDYAQIFKSLHYDPLNSKVTQSANEPFVRRALLIWFQGANFLESQANAAFENVLNGLTQGDEFFVNIPPDDYAWRVKYAGEWQGSAVVDTPSGYEYLVYYEGRVERVGGQGSPYPAVGEFNDPNAFYIGGQVNVELIPFGALNFVSSSVTTNLWNTESETDAFVNWQLKNAYYGLNSGSRESMIEAIKQVLTVEDGTVAVSPNYNGQDFRIHLRTLNAETPDVDNWTSVSAAVLEAAEPTRPAGFIFTHESVAKLFFTLNNIGIGRMDRSVLG